MPICPDGSSGGRNRARRHVSFSFVGAGIPTLPYIRAGKIWLIAWIGTRQSRPLRRGILNTLLPLRRCLTFGLCPRGALLAGAHGSMIPGKRIGAKSVGWIKHRLGVPHGWVALAGVAAVCRIVR